MNTVYRAELQRLVKAYDDHGENWPEDDVEALRQAVERARTALAHPKPIRHCHRLPSETNWQPIETAPKDRTDVLVLLNCAGVAVVHIAFWRSREEWELSGQYCGGWDSLEDWEGWWSYTENSVGQSKLDGSWFPTHWMPLPPLPTT